MSVFIKRLSRPLKGMRPAAFQRLKLTIRDFKQSELFFTVEI